MDVWEQQLEQGRAQSGGYQDYAQSVSPPPLDGAESNMSFQYDASERRGVPPFLLRTHNSTVLVSKKGTYRGGP